MGGNHNFLTRLRTGRYAKIGNLVLKSKNLELLKAVIYEQTHVAQLQDKGIALRKTLLLQGAHGNGRCFSAMVIAGESMLPFFRVRTSLIFKEDCDETIDNLYTLFSLIAEERGVYLIDDIDTALDMKNDKVVDTLANLLKENRDYGSSLIILTSQPGFVSNDSLSIAIDQTVTYSYPDREDIKKLFEIYLPHLDISDEENVSNRFILATDNMSCADIVRVLHRARSENEITGVPVRNSQLLSYFIDNIKETRFCL